MNPSQNIFGPIEQLSVFFQPGALLEIRIENDGNDNPIYVGYSPTPNDDPDLLDWYIIKITYDGEAIIRVQQPDDGPKFAYSWTDRATYFS